MRTFLLRDGDFVVGEGGYVTISGPEKVRQDLGIAMREPLGTDRFHPRWGSQLDGYVGLPATRHTEMLVVAEITRLVRNYAGVQSELFQRGTALRRKPIFTSGEIVDEVEKVNVRQEYDRYLVQVVLRTLSGERVDLTRTVEVG